MSIFAFLDALRKRIALIIIIVNVCIICSAFVSVFLIKPLYESDTSLVVQLTPTSGASSQTDYSQMLMQQQLIKTYGNIINGRTVIEQAAAALHMPKDKLKDSLSVETVEGTLIINIRARSSDPASATNMANTVAIVSIQEIKRIMNIENVERVNTAETPDKPVSPSVPRNVILAALLGFAVSAGIIFLREYTDTTIKSEAAAHEKLGMNVIGVLPMYKIERRKA